MLPLFIPDFPARSNDGLPELTGLVVCLEAAIPSSTVPW
jgi:hypothetical protein